MRQQLSWGRVALCFVVTVLGLPAASCTNEAKAPPAHDGGSSQVKDAGDKSDGSAPECSQDSDCDDGVYCNGGESCVNRKCVQGTAIRCDDGIECTIDTCSEHTHGCVATPPDADGDGHFDITCLNPKGMPYGDDCDDADAMRYPGNVEVCDAKNRDEDCDPKTYGDKDTDKDGFVDAKCCNAESAKKDAPKHCGNDCDDLKFAVNPKASEVCDEYDNDCDAKTDEGVTVSLWPDKDFDLHGDQNADPVKKCAGAHGFATDDKDCNDKDPEIYEGALEICDNKDNNCNGLNDADDVTTAAPWYEDKDGDQFGDDSSVPQMSCLPLHPKSLNHTDCNDGNKHINPSATEQCNALDDDCDGKKNFKIGTNDFEDDDDDGIADFKCGGQDCDDNDPATGAGLEEICDGRDNDCDGAVDEGVTSTVWYLDKDGDGFGTASVPATVYCGTVPGRVTVAGDCDDNNKDVKPGAAETCDNRDNDCNGLVDDGLTSNVFYSDADGDGYGSTFGLPIVSCQSTVQGRVKVGGDCNDGNPAVHNGAAETCDALDNDCNGLVDDGLTVKSWYVDADSDGYGDVATAPVVTCAASVQGRIPTGGDCNDGSAAVHPGVTELCDGINNDCDLVVDEAPASAACSTAFANATGFCQNAACRIDVCDQGWSNCDGNQANGCENPQNFCGGGSLPDSGVGSGGTSGGGTGGGGTGGSAGIPAIDSGVIAPLPCAAMGGIQSKSITITNQADITANANVYCISGNLTIQNTSLVDLTGLSNLQYVGGNVYIYNNTSMTSLKGLDGLSTVGGYFQIQYMPALANLDALVNLTTIGGDLYLYNNGLADLGAASPTPRGLINLESVGGYVQLYSNNGLTSLAGLNGLKTIGNYLYIYANNSLAYMDGVDGSQAFTSLEQIGGYLYIGNNGALITLAGFPVLERVGSYVQIADNNNLQQITGFTGTAAMFGGDVQIYQNNKLKAITGFYGTTRIAGNLLLRDNGVLDTMQGFATVGTINGNITIYNNPALPDIGGFNSLTNVGSYIDIHDNTTMAGVSNFPVLKTMGSDLRIRSLPNLTTLSGFKQLTTIGNNLDVNHNPLLASIGGLNKLGAISNDLRIQLNAGLTDISGLNSGTLNTLGNILAISGNPQLSSCQVDVVRSRFLSHGWQGGTALDQTCCNSGCTTCSGTVCSAGSGGTGGQNGVYQGNVSISSVADLQLLSTSTKLQGTLTVSSSAVGNLSGLDNLTEITGDVVIQYNNSLTSLSGLGNLTKIDGNLTIQSNGQLNNVAELHSLQQVKGNVYIYGNGALSTLAGLSSLTSIGGYFYLYANAALGSMNGLQNLTDVGCYMYIASNSSMTSMSELTSLVNVGMAQDCSNASGQRYFQIYGNGALQNLDGINALVSLGGPLQITNNYAMTSLGGFAALKTTNGNLEIYSNQNLTTVAGFAALTKVLGGNFLVHDNPSLASITGFPLLNATTSYNSSTGYFELYNNGSLGTLSGFPALASVANHLYIYNNGSLSNINGFGALTSVSGPVDIRDNATLSHVDGFGNLGSVAGTLSITNNVSLLDIVGLTKLATVDNALIIAGNDSLTNFNGIDSVISIGTDVRVQRNPVLSSIAGLRSGTFTTLGGLLSIFANPSLSRCEISDLVTKLGSGLLGGSAANESGANDGCMTCTGAVCSAGPGGTTGQPTIFKGGITVTKANDLVTLKNVTYITGDLTIQNSAITNLFGLGNLNRVGGNFYMYNNTSLSNVTDLANLSKVDGYLSIQYNSMLASVSGFAALTSVGGYLYMYGNSSLTNLNGFANLTTIGSAVSSGQGYLTIYGQAALNSIDGIIKTGGTGKLQNVNGNVDISGNGQLPDCATTVFKSSLQGQGWTGFNASFNNNYTCSMPKTCMGTVCL